jgi:hypothetical protein
MQSALLTFPLFALLTAALGLAASILGWRVMRGFMSDDLFRLLEILARGTFSFLVFLLALTLTSVRENFVQAESVVAQESLELRQLLRGPAVSGELRAEVAAYARAVADREWPALSEATPRLSPEAGAALDRLRGTCAGDDLRAIARIEHLRESRLAHARAGAHAAFWMVMAIVLLVGSFMHGRSPPSRGQLVVLALYLSAFGLVFALIREFERPFSGWVAASPDPIRSVVEMTGN